MKSFTEVLNKGVYNAILKLTEKYADNENVKRFINLLHGDVFQYDDKSSFCLYIGNEIARLELSEEIKSNRPQENPQFFTQILLDCTTVNLIIGVDCSNKLKKEKYYYHFIYNDEERNEFTNLETILESFFKNVETSKDVDLRCEFYDRGIIIEQKRKL